MQSVELFVGAGGLALGLTETGFKHAAMVEWNKDACKTIRHNTDLSLDSTTDWPEVSETDARFFDYSSFKSIDVVAGGPPCQPFSMGGKHQAHLDPRDMFPEAIRAIRELKPKVFIFENVKGLLRSSFADYFNYIILQCSYPDLIASPDETWLEHLERLERHHTAGNHEATENRYNVVYRLLNAANYGVPQKRERVFIVGFRADLNLEWNFPHPTHSYEALLHEKWVTGDYWKKHGIRKDDIPSPSPRLSKKIEALKKNGLEEELLPWVTVRDAIGDMPDPVKTKESVFNNHEFKDGAKSYPGHTGSPLDEPSKALKAGAHGVPGGENMIDFGDGTVRYFTVREAARIQTFPDDYIFQGSWGEVMRQLGNAVPVKLSQIVGTSVAETLEGRNIEA